MSVLLLIGLVILVIFLLYLAVRFGIYIFDAIDCDDSGSGSSGDDSGFGGGDSGGGGSSSDW